MPRLSRPQDGHPQGTAGCNSIHLQPNRPQAAIRSAESRWRNPGLHLTHHPHPPRRRPPAGWARPMLKISRTQFRAFEDLAKRQHAQRVSRLAQAHGQAPAVPDEQALEAAIAHARRLRISREDLVLRIARLRAEHGPDLDRLPWAQPLHCAEPDEVVRMSAADALRARCSAGR